MLIFSDTMVGEIKDGQLGEWTMVNNTVAYLKGSEPDESKISFHWKKGMNEKPETFFVPATPSAEKGDNYGLGDGVVNTETEDGKSTRLNASHKYESRMQSSA